MANAGRSLRALLKDAVDVRQNGLLTGVVKKESPLEIQVESDSQLLLTESNLYVPRRMQSYSIDAQIETGGATSAARITFDAGLKAGDVVYLLSFDKGAVYFVLDLVNGG